jgi:heme exporter protein A
MLAARGLGRRYGRRWALRGLDLDLPSGSIIAVVGPNGAGKTTLLKLLAGLDRPQEGRVLLAGRAVLEARERRGAIGLVTHQPRLYPQLSPLELLRFHARIHGLRPAAPALAAILDAQGLTPWAHRPARTLSRGLAQRLALARALLPDPAVLLLDEPFTGLDPAAAADLTAGLRAARAAGKAILLTTHDLERLPGLADGLLALRGGRAVWRGPIDGWDADDLRSAYALWVAPPSSPEAPEAASSVGQRAPAAHKAPEGRQAPAASPVRQPEASFPMPPAPGFGRTVLALVHKDLLVEARGREALLPALVFGLVVTVVFQFGLPRGLDGLAAGAAGALWVALLFAAVLAQGRGLAAEQEAGGLLGLRAAPVDLGAVFVARWLTTWLTCAVMLLVLLPAFVVWLGLPAARAPALGAVALLGLAGWCAIGTLVAVLGASSRARETLLPLLGFPLALPLLLPCVQASNLVLEGAAIGAMTPALVLIGAFGVIFWVLGLWLYPLVLEDAGDS